MSIFSGWFTKAALGVDGKDVMKGAASAVGNVMDRFGFTAKLSEGAKMDKTITYLERLADSDKITEAGVDSARNLALQSMLQNKSSWLVAQLNSSFRPMAGYFALICLTDRYWSQILNSLITSLNYKPVDPSTATQVALTSIIGAFFGFRHLAKKGKITQEQ